MSVQARAVSLEIDHQRLSLRTDREDEFLRYLVEDLNARIEVLKRGAPRAQPQQLYMLLALQLADELAGERGRSQRLGEEVALRSARLLDMIDAELGGGVGQPSVGEPSMLAGS
jgi:cell division protein ZapA (FtsZ GTPase activity inhibitor)